MQCIITVKLGMLSIDVFATIQSLFVIMLAVTAINVINIFSMRTQVESYRNWGALQSMQINTINLQ